MWTRIRRFFKDSEVIFLARLQLLFGALVTAVAEVDPGFLGPFIPSQWFGIYLLLAGIIIEIARRLRDEELKKRG